MKQASHNKTSAGRCWQPYACYLLGVLICARHSFLCPIPLPAVTLLSLVVLLAGLARRFSINLPLLVFVGLCAASIVIHPWPAPWLRSQRFMAFVVGMLCFSPLLLTDKLAVMRAYLAKSIFVTLGVMVSLSFLVWIVCLIQNGEEGIWMEQFHYYGFKGIFERGMTLSPVAGTLAIISAAKVIDLHTRSYRLLHVVLFVIGSITCVVAGSRIAIVGLVIGLCVLLWQNYRHILALLKNRKAKIVSICCGVTILAMLPSSLNIVRYKLQIGEKHGSTFYSRQQLFSDRKEELLHSPWLGIGYANEFPSETNGGDVRNIQPGSSWLSILTYTGVVGGLVFLWFLTMMIKHIRRKENRQPYPPAFFPLLIFLFIDAMTEGWLLFGGALMFPLFWLTISYTWQGRNSSHTDERKLLYQ